jgi:hypothetical protein
VALQRRQADRDAQPGEMRDECDEASFSAQLEVQRKK